MVIISVLVTTEEKNNMATVRFSEELRDTIQHNARRMFNDKLAKARDNIPTHWAQIVYDLMFAEHKDAMAALPKTYFIHTNNITLYGFGIVEGVWDKGFNQSAELRLDEPRPFPNDISDPIHGLDGGTRNYGGWYLDATDPRWDTLKAEFIVYSQAIKDIEFSRDEFVEGVCKVINVCSTLAPALQAWPPLWDLLPLEKQERHKETIERVKKEIVVEGVDLDSMTAISTMAKITRGGN